MVGSILRHGELWLAFTRTDGSTIGFVFLDFIAAFGGGGGNWGSSFYVATERKGKQRKTHRGIQGLRPLMPCSMLSAAPQPAEAPAVALVPSSFSELWSLPRSFRVLCGFLSLPPLSIRSP